MCAVGRVKRSRRGVVRFGDTCATAVIVGADFRGLKRVGGEHGAHSPKVHARDKTWRGVDDKEEESG